ncbi:MAG: GNAT family N-acetyltransferase [Caulobacteraceae bacterium]
MSEITIRRAVAADAESLSDLGRATFTEAFGHMYPKADLNDFLDGNHTPAKAAAAIADPDAAVWVADGGGRLVGYSQASGADMPHPDLRPEHGELKRLYVLASHQNLRLGARLVEPALAWMDARPGPQWISVWSENYGAQRFYGRYGFAKAGEYEFVVGNWRDREFIFRRG